MKHGRIAPVPSPFLFFLTAKGRRPRPQGAENHRSWRMVQRILTAKGRRQAAQMNLDRWDRVHGARKAETINRTKSNKLGYLGIYCISFYMFLLHWLGYYGTVIY